MKKALFLLLCLLLLPLDMAAQTQRVRGTVTDAEGEPLIGVAVRVRGTQNGAQTDLDGHLVFDCKPGDILDITFIGFKPNTAKVGKRDILVTLEEDVKTMEQVVINGYTQTDIRKATGSVGILTEKDRCFCNRSCHSCVLLLVSVYWLGVFLLVCNVFVGI